MYSKRRLVRMPNHLGDACMALPALARLAQASIEPLAVGRPWIRELLSGFHYEAAALPGGRWERVQALRALSRSRAAGEAVLLTNSFSSALEMRLAGVRPEGYRTDHRKWLLDRSYPVPKAWDEGSMHTSEYYWHLAGRALGLSGAPLANPMPPPALKIPVTAAARARAALDRAGAPQDGTEGTEGTSRSGNASVDAGGDYVVLCPAAVGLHRGRVKRWDGFDRLARALAAQGLRIVACPGPGEQAAVRAAVPLAHIAGPLDLPAFAALLAGARLVVANDSGASHLAAAAGARLLTVFGVTDPRRTAPRGRDVRWVGSERAWPAYDEVEAAALGRLSEPPAPEPAPQGASSIPSSVPSR